MAAGRGGTAGALLLAAACLLPGCLQPGGAGAAPPPAFPAEVSAQRPPPPAFDFSTAIDPDHGGAAAGHAAAALHAGSHGLRLVGHTPLAGLARPGSVAQGGGYASLDVWGRYACVAHWSGPGGEAGGATVVDLADPAAPRVLWTVPSGLVSSDCQFTDDGGLLLVASSGSPREAAGAGPGGAGARGLAVYDVRDKARPRFLFGDTRDDSGWGYHNVFTAAIAGVDYVVQPYSGDILAVDEAAGRLSRVASVDAADHDAWVGRHPVTGQWLLASGMGNGTVLYGLDDPAHPVLLSVWPGRGGGGNGWHRQWPVLGTVGGRAYLVVAGETADVPEPYTVLDVTDPAEPFEVGQWELPGSPRPAGAPLWTFSPHEFETWDGYVAAANYHAGVWLFDVGSPERARAPVTLGYYLPHEAVAGNLPWPMAPWVWGAAFDDRGYVVATDLSSGLYVLEFDGTRG